MNKMMNALILENFGDHEFKRVELPPRLFPIASSELLAAPLLS